MSKRSANILRNMAGDFVLNNAKLSVAKAPLTNITATTTLTKTDSGRLAVVNDLASSATLTLPSAEAGLVFEFVYVGNAAEAEDLIISTGADANYFVGGLVQHDPDNGGDDTVVYHPNGSSNSKVTVKTPDSGTRMRCICQDGTLWLLEGKVISATTTGGVFADQ